MSSSAATPRTGDAFLAGDPRGRYYAGRLLWHQGEWHFFAWLYLDHEGHFIGALSDPMPLTVHGDGSLSVQLPGSSTGKGFLGAAS
jgi:hypothetical protein